MTTDTPLDASAPPARAKADEIRRTLDALFQPGDIVEFRTEKSDSPELKWKRTCSGYFDYDHFEDMAEAATSFDGLTHVWVTINPVIPQLMARCANGVMENAKHTTTDGDIDRRRNLFIDSDPKRPAGTSSSDVQHDAALAKMREIAAFLADRGFAEPVVADSGNGGHLNYAIDLPSDGESTKLLQDILLGLDVKFGDTVVGVDRTTWNASRLIKISGTKAVKGEHHPDYPHRYSRLLSAPETRQVVPLEALRALAADLKPPTPAKAVHEHQKGLQRPAPVRVNGQKPDFDVADFLAHHGIGHHPPVTTPDGRCKYVLDACPFDPSHTGKDAAVFVDGGGVIGFKCFHNSCGTRGWRDVRLHFEPGAYDFGQRVQASRPGRDTGATDDVPPGLDALLAEADRNDVGNRHRFVTRHSQNVRYVAEQKDWYVFDGVRWASQGDAGAVVELGIETVAAIRQEADTIPVEMNGDGQDANEKKRDALRAHAQASHARRKIVDMLALAQSHPDVAAKQTDFDQHVWLLNTANGTLDLRTGTLRGHSREDMLTQVIPVSYDPFADCPQWERFMEGIQPDKDVRDFLQRYLGYSLTGITEDEIFIFLYGTGANGKSTLIETMSALMGDLAATMRAEVIATGAAYAAEARFGMGCVVGRRLITVAELEERSSFNEMRLKALTTGNSVDLEIKHKAAYTYKPKAKFILAGNYKPKVIGTDDGVWRRVALVPFDQQFTDDAEDPMLRKDRHLGEKLRGELPGILNWALTGLQSYLENGLALPEVVKAATDEYRADSDVLGQFIAECCVLKPSAVANAQELYEAYAAWCIANGHKYVMPTNTFGGRLKSRGLEVKHTKFGNVRRGIGLVTSPDRSSDIPARRLRPAAQDTVEVSSDQRIYGDL